MATQSLEQRVTVLEAQVGKLQDELGASKKRMPKDWRRTIRAFTDDEGMQKILQDAMRLREAERRKVKAKPTAKRSIGQA